MLQWTSKKLAVNSHSIQDYLLQEGINLNAALFFHEGFVIRKSVFQTDLFININHKIYFSCLDLIETEFFPPSRLA